MGWNLGTVLNYERNEDMVFNFGILNKAILFCDCQKSLYGLIYYICTYNLNPMDTKLTLKLNQEVIEKAKRYASGQQMSLSRIVEAYLQTLVSENNTDEFEISPFVKSIATGTKIPAELDYKKE